jgi:hypothetical protein
LQWWWVWWANYYTTGMNFDNTTNKLSLYVSWANTVSWYINLSWASNWNSAYNWTITSGNVLSNRYNTSGTNINTLATTTLSCAAWQIAKYNGSVWVCDADLQWWWGIDRYVTGMTYNSSSDLLTVYVSWSTAVTANINPSGSNNRNSAYNRTNNTWFTIGSWYINTWVNITSIAKLSCSSWQIAKTSSTWWICGTDLTGSAVWSSVWLTGASNVVYYNSWNVGIGKIPSAAYKLDVNGNVQFTLSDADPAFYVYDNPNWTSAFEVNSLASTILLDKSNNGYNVGIGTTSPFWKFQVWNGLPSISMWSAPMWSNFSYIYNYVWFNAARNSIGQWRMNGDGWSNGSSVIMSNAWGSIYFASIPSTGGTIKTLDDTGVYNNIKMIMQSNGYLGIGTLTPQSKLDVNGNIRISNGWYIWASSNINQLYLWLNGNVGIWVWSPVSRLEVNWGVKIWLSASTCDAAHYWEIKYDGYCFRWCNPEWWISLHSCDAPQCGTSNGQAYASLAVGNCSWSASIGWFTPHPINNDGTAYWTRTCADIGQTVSCAANKIQPGNCGTCETVLCDTGTYINTQRDSWHPDRLTRDCVGTYGWSTTACIDISGCSAWWL